VASLTVVPAVSVVGNVQVIVVGGLLIVILLQVLVTLVAPVPQFAVTVMPV
jgi:hypothetical protein